MRCLPFPSPSRRYAHHSRLVFSLALNHCFSSRSRWFRFFCSHVWVVKHPRPIVPISPSFLLPPFSFSSHSQSWQRCLYPQRAPEEPPPAPPAVPFPTPCIPSSTLLDGGILSTMISPCSLHHVCKKFQYCAHWAPQPNAMGCRQARDALEEWRYRLGEAAPCLPSSA